MKRLCALGLLILVAPAILAQAKKSDSVVKIEASATKPDADGNQTVTVTLDIDKGWHVYANEVGNDTFATGSTQVLLPAGLKDTAKITYPPGKLVMDKDVGDYKTYEGKVTITAKVKRDKGDTGPLEFGVRIQACDDKNCLQKVTVKKSVP